MIAVKIVNIYIYIYQCLHSAHSHTYNMYTYIIIFTDKVARQRFLWDEQMGDFPNGPARILYFAMDYLKQGKIPVIANEVWRDRGHGGFPYYGGDIELWRAPSAAWNIGNVASRRVLV